MNDIAVFLLKAGLTGIVLIGTFVWAFCKGKDEREKEQLKAERVRNARAKTIQDSIVTDRSKRDRVRREYDRN